MTQISEPAKLVARAAAEAFGGQPRVNRFYDASEAHAIDVLTCEARPSVGFSSYSTIGLHRIENFLDDDDIRVELAGIMSSEVDEFANALATAAFLVMKDAWLCAPGVVFPALLSDYGLSPVFEHVLWVPPFPWEELSSVEISADLAVHWLLAIPISASERAFLLDRGYDEFEELFSEKNVEYYDLNRAPVV